MKKACIALIVLSVLFYSGCEAGGGQAGGTDVVSSATAARYDEREIREYEGVRLDPATGPRDNSIKGVQNVDMSTYMLKVTGLVESPLEMTYEQALEYPAYKRLITLHCVEGWDATILWTGVMLTDIIADAGAKSEADTVIFKCYDGYTTSMPLETVRERDMLLAYEANEAPLPPAMGYPFIVVAEDKLGYKWARWVTEIELSNDESYKGYWESVGYPNDAEVPQKRKDAERKPEN